MVSTRRSDVEPRTDRMRKHDRGRAQPNMAAADGGAGPGRMRPVTVKARVAGRRIVAAAEASDVLEVRSRLRTLARQVARRPDNVRSLTRIETQIAECLDEAAARATTSRERWLLDEASTWAVAWLAGARRAGVSSGSLLERLLGEAAAADGRLAGGDVSPARFLVVLARLFRDVESCRRHEPRVAAVLAGDVARLVAPSGAVALAGSAAIVERVALWSECRELALATGGVPWGDDTERQWAAAVGTVVRLLGGGGRILAGSGQLPAAASAALIRAVNAAGRRGAGGPRFPKRLRRAVRILARPGQRARDAGGRLPPPDFHDAEAGLTIIRSAWADGGAVAGLRVLVDHRESTPWLEIAVEDRLLVAGPWRFHVRVGGRDREPQAPWTVEAWESDRAVTFLELSAPLGDGIRFDRHLVVLPRQGVVLAADAVVAREADTPPAANGAAHVGNGVPRSDGIEYVGTLPLAAALEAEPAADSREIVLYDTTTRGMALPLALNEWRSGSGGSFGVAADGLTLTQSGHGRLYAPVWIDLNAAHVGGPLTWRQLTVADSRTILPAWQAVGYRVQAGDEQWLVYRALDVVRNRTLLGCNVACEFLVGRIRPRGLVTRTLEIA